MMIAALVALLTAALAGLFLAVRHFIRKGLPASVAILHGLGGVAGLAFVLLTIVREPTFMPIRTVLYLLIVTVILGCINLLFHVRRVRHRASIIVLHGLTAVASAAVLLQAIRTHVVARPSSVAVTTSEQLAQTFAPSAGEVVAADAGLTTAYSSPERMPAEVRRALAQLVRFDTNGREMRAESRRVITDVAAALRAHPEITLVQVQGYADQRGDDATNVALTRVRAAVVVEALVGEGVAPERLSAAGYGARCALGSPAPARGARWDQDRRVAFVALEIDGSALGGPVTCDRARDLIPVEDRRFAER